MTAAALACAATPQTARAASEDGCVDGWKSWCDERGRAPLLEKFELNRAEDRVSQDDVLVRVFFIAGRNREMPVVEFRRRLEQRQTTVRALAEHGVRVRTAQISPDAWGAVEAAVQRVHASPSEPSETFVLETGDGPVVDSVCLHPWKVLIETVSNGRVSRRTRTTCDADPLIEDAFALARLARSEFPPCAALGIEAESPVSALAECARLYGSEVDAAEVMNRYFGAPLEDPGAAVAGEVADLFAADVEIVWADREAVRTRAEAVALWNEVNRDVRLDAYYSRIDGVASRQVVVTGLVSEMRVRAEQPNQRTVSHAEYEQTWIRDSDGAWRIRRWTVRPFRIVN